MSDKDLACAMIVRAYTDMELIHTNKFPGGEMIADAWDASYFLTNESGAWAESRALWCEIAGLSEKTVREKAETILPAFNKRQEYLASKEHRAAHTEFYSKVNARKRAVTRRNKEMAATQ